MLLDKLGLSARLGLSLVVRQTYYGFWFALVDQKLEPRPNYWLALAFKRLVGPRVLDVHLDMTPAPAGKLPVRAYAHCTAASSGYPSGSVVIYVLNIRNESTSALFNVSNSHVVDQFLFTAPRGDVTSTSIELNGAPVGLVSDSQLPVLKPQQVVTDAGVKMPPYSMAFYVIKAGARACK